MIGGVLLVLRLYGGAGTGGEAPLSLDQVRALYPEAAALRPGDDLTTVLGEDDAVLGFAVKTLPQGARAVGYAGPSDVLLAMDTDGAVTGARLLWSGDTPEHAAAVRNAPGFFEAFHGWRPGGENDTASVDAVSGATLTSLAIVESVAVRLGGKTPSLKFPEAVALADVQRIFPEAARVDAPDPETGAMAVRDTAGAAIGALLRSAPHGDAIPGYQGPSDALIGLDPDGAVYGVTLGRSWDNQRYADYVRNDRYFREKNRGTPLEDFAALDPEAVWADGVSGATITSAATMQAAIHRAGVYVNPPEPVAIVTAGFQPGLRDAITIGALVFGCLVSFTRLRARPAARVALQIYLIAALGLWAGDMVSLAVLGGWAGGAVPLQRAPGLVALVAAALILPWATGKPVYCQHLCPHGAAQALLFRWTPGRVQLPHRWRRALGVAPFLVLLGGVAIAAAALPVSLSALEPFDAWIFGIGGAATITIAVVGLAASSVIPQAYCKYGCPTGLVLEYVRRRPHETRLNRRDALAAVLLTLALALGYAVT